LDPSARDLLRFEQKGGCLRNILTLQVPAVAADHAAALLQRTLDEADLTQQSITTWIWHAGGRNVLAALQRRLGLEEAAFGWSAMTLRDLGNVSSAFVIHVLQRALAGHAPGGFWWMSSFGAGFSCHGALLQVE
jgi:alkylresorcinol/alkylpyrone synthase